MDVGKKRKRKFYRRRREIERSSLPLEGKNPKRARGLP